MPRYRYIGWLIAVALLLPSSLAAQQNATVAGTVVDESQGVMPGATVTVIEVSTGTQSLAVTAADGRYEFGNLAPGQYKLHIELSGFATAEITNLELLVGQHATVAPVVMKVATVAETVTVTGEAPLIDITSAQVAGNIDRAQMAELPLQGRNWQELSMMVKGVTANNITNTPGVSDDQYQLNLDGQQITQRVAGSGFGEPKLSREAIAEFQVQTNLYDITEGRSTGIQVQAITRSGTNDFHGSTFGFFRSNDFNAPDLVKGAVLPYSDQQTGFTLGGPVIRDKVHFFGSYEYERNPLTAVLTPSALPDQSFELPSNTVQGNYLGKVDFQQSSKNSYTIRAQRWTSDNPQAITSGTSDPNAAEADRFYSTNLYGTWTHVASSNRLMEAHLGIDRFSWYNDPLASNDVQFYNAPFGVPVFQFPNLTLGGQQNEPNYTWQTEYSSRIDNTWTLGRHELKFGAEFLADRDTKVWDLNRRGTFVFNKQPTTAALEADFPEASWNNPLAWNISNLQPFLKEYDVFFNPNNYLVNVPRPYTAAWIGDNWRATNDLTVNLGLRYDLDLDGLNPPGVVNTPIMINNGFYPAGNYGYQTGVKDLTDFGPRAGFAYNVGGKNDLVIRGGTGIYYNFPVSNVTYRQQFYNESVTASFFPTSPGFSMQNPTGGVTAAQVLSGAVATPAQTTTIIAPGYRDPRGWQSSIGFQKQLGKMMSVDVDYTDLEELDQVRSTDMNLFYNPATGYNLDPTIFGRPNPAYTEDEWLTSDGKTQTRNLAMSFTRRFGHNFQAGIVNTIGLSMKDDTTGFGYTADNQFNPLADWARSTGFQRETFRANGIVNLPWTLSLSGSYFYGSGSFYNATSSMDPYSKPGTNRLNVGPAITIPTAILSRWDGPAVIPTGALWPRDALQGLPLHKVDLRLTSRVKLSGSMKVEILAEIFNLFDAKNYGGYNTTITSANFGQPVASSGNAYVPREGQLGVRLVF